MKKLYIVIALALCAVLSVEAAGGCKYGTCVRKPTVKMPVVFGPVPRPVVTAPAPAKSATASWYASRITQGAESSAKIRKDIEASIVATEKKLKNYRAQLKRVTGAGASAEKIAALRKKIKDAETELNTLKRMLSCVK
jgi:hypothetical protein